jgi:gliding motility-associated-like protein
VWVPDAFTVNQDGLNEIWGTFPLFVREYNMKVYNRWGQKVWESDSKKQQWDALNQKEKMSDAVFAWVLEFKGWDDKTYIKTGTVTVIH